MATWPKRPYDRVSGGLAGAVAAGGLAGVAAGAGLALGLSARAGSGRAAASSRRPRRCAVVVFTALMVLSNRPEGAGHSRPAILQWRAGELHLIHAVV